MNKPNPQMGNSGGSATIGPADGFVTQAGALETTIPKKMPDRLAARAQTKTTTQVPVSASHEGLFKRLKLAVISKLILPPCDRLPFLRHFLASAGVTPAHVEDRPVRVPIDGSKTLQIRGVPTNHLSFQMYWRGINYYEPFTRTVIEQLTASTELFLDIGANIGFFGLIAAKMNPRLQVVAFEPNPRMYGILSENKRLNDLSNLTAEPLALSSQPGESPLFISNSDMSASLVPDFQADFSPHVGSVSVRTVSVDSYLQRFPSTRSLVMKVDVEGHEIAVLQGASRTISSLKPDLIMEVLADFDPATLRQLKTHGYRFYKITHEGLTETDAVTLTTIGDFVFYNYLFTTRSPGELSAISEKIRKMARRINLYHTSKFARHL